MGLVIKGQHLEQYRGNDTHVVIPEGVRIIDDYAFSNASSLVSAVIPESVQEIGTRAFYACKNLLEVQIPDSVRFLGSGTFVRCTSLIRVKLPGGLSGVPDSAFFGCSALQHAEMPREVARIGESAFAGCTSLKEVTLPDTVQILGKKSFQGCTALTKLELPGSLVRIGEQALENCSSLRVLDVPSSVQTIGTAALDTHGRITLRIPHLPIAPAMLDAHWNQAWGYDKDHNRPYQLDHAVLPHVELPQWKKEAQCILAVCYLETYTKPAAGYDAWITGHKDECLQRIVTEERWDALRTCLKHAMVSREEILPFIDRIHDPAIRAEILSSGSASAGSLLDLF